MISSGAMAISIQSFTGKSVRQYKDDLAKLRIEVFREYPYLYDGSLEYEEKYLEAFIKSKDSIIVVAFDDEEVIGVSTGIPLINEPYEIQKPWIEHGVSVDKVFYFSESVLLKAYRGLGIGVRFFEEREAWAKKLGYEVAIFCSVIRPENDRERPEHYVPLDNFWRNRGFERKNGYVCEISWKEIGEQSESTKALEFWYKNMTG